MDTHPVSSAELPVVVPRPLPAAPARPLTRTPRLSVVVVNYHRWDETASVVRQLRANDLVEVVDGRVQATQAGYDLRALIEHQEL